MAQSAYQLIIGNKNSSSWSLRPWLVMTRMGLSFDEIRIDLRAPDCKAQILRHSPSGKVPALKIGGLTVWDSLAIMEHLADRYPDAHLWPECSDARSIARSVCLEMHAGFAALREHCPMDFAARKPMQRLPEPVERDVRRILAIWRDCRNCYGQNGAFLFGEFCCADAVYAPVASRLRSYIPDLGAYGDDGTAAAYIDEIFLLPEMQAWSDQVESELQAATVED